MTSLSPMTASATPEWVGPFSPIAFTQVLKRVAAEARSGDLSVVSGNSIKTVCLEKGAVRFAASNLREDRLGETMLAHEFITTEDYALASERMEAEGCRFGEALVRMGRLSSKQLTRELAVQVQKIVLSLFQIGQGLYSFEEASEGGARMEMPFSLSIHPLILKGVRRVNDGRMILSALPPADTLVRIADAPPFSFDYQKLKPAERAVLEAAGDCITIGAIVRGTGIERGRALRGCYALLAAGLLELVPAEDAPLDTAQEPVEPVVTIEEGSPEPFREIIVGQFDRLDLVSDADLLGVAEECNADELRAAYEELCSEWSALRERVESQDLLDKIDAIEFRLAAALHQLTIEQECGFETVETMEASVPVVEIAELKPEALLMAQKNEDEALRRKRIQQLERDATVHLQVKDWNGAISLLHELVTLDPESARYQAMLGSAMQHHPTLRKSAEQHFLEAVRLAPEQLDYRLCLGSFYRTGGQRARAQVEFEAALRIDPTNEDAKRHLSVAQDNGRVQGLLKKLFG